MESAVSICYETLERQLGRHIPDFQVFQGCQNSLLYDQRHRITEFNVAAAEPSEERISRASGAAEVAVSRTFEATHKWTMPIRNWGKVRGELSVTYPERLPE